MATYATRSGWEAAQGGGPELLYDFDAVNETTENLAGVTSLGGLTVTESNSGSPTTWRVLNGTGIEITGDGEGFLRVDWADIGTDLMNRALDNTDTLVVCLQWASGMELATVADTLAVIEMRPTAANNNTQVAGIKKDGANNRWCAHWDGSGLAYALRDNLANVRSVSTFMLPGGSNTISYFSTAVLGTDAPQQVGTEYNVSDSNVGAYVSSGPGAWAKDEADAFFWWILVRKSGETVATVIERLQIWLLPGSPNV